MRPCFLPNEGTDILDTYKEKRAAALYKEDESKTYRFSHRNPQIIELYKEYLGEPNSHKAHERCIPRTKRKNVLIELCGTILSCE